MPTSIENKVNTIFYLMELLANGEELYPQNIRLQETLGLTGSPEAKERKLRRYLNEIHNTYNHIVVTEKKVKEFGDRKLTIYRVVDKDKDVSKVFKAFIEQNDDLSWLLQIVHEYNPRMLRDEKDRLERVLKEDENVFLFISAPFELFETEEKKLIFRHLKTAVKNHEYRTIHKGDGEVLSNVKCLKMLHMNNNWYLAAETEEGKLRFLRLSFMERVTYSKKTSYQSKTLEKYASFFEKVQNPMTLDAPFKTARLLASPRVALYFDEGMKPFFPSQKFVAKRDDGSVEFTLRYTQPMEILPFIKQWQPDLEILEPVVLREDLARDLRQALGKMG